MVSKSNTIAYLSGELLELIGKLPHYLIIGTDKEGSTVFSNKQETNLSGNTSQPIEQLILQESSWRGELDKHHYFQQSELSLEAFKLSPGENNDIQYVFIIRLQEPAVNTKAINLSKENQAVIELLNNIIGLANNLIKETEKGSVFRFAQSIYDKAWNIKESLQGSVIKKVESLPYGYDLIDFNEVFEKALNKEQYDFDAADVIIDAQSDAFIFFSHFKCLQLLVAGLTKWCFDHSTSQPVNIKFKVSESDTGATIRVESKPVESLKKAFTNDKIQELVNTLKGRLTVISISDEKVVLEVDIPGA